VPLVDGAHHITFLTEDMDRLLAFYVRVFDAEVTLDMTEEGLRHAFLKVGPTTVLHPFRDMRSLWIMGYFDPDGAAHEVILQRPGFADADMLEREHWTTVTLD
jgi:catechol 2,3-dioxygenase-like lactoylglutathione lyase family enzyme